MKGISSLPSPKSPSRTLSRRRTLEKKKPYEFPCQINEFNFCLPNYTLPISLNPT